MEWVGTEHSITLARAPPRVLPPLAVPQWLPMALVVACVAWTVAFAIYLFVFTLWLLKTRFDGEEG